MRPLEDNVLRNKLVIYLLVMFCTASVQAATEFYVDASRSINGNGSAANPWKARSDVNWSTIAAALQNGPVALYFSSRGTWNDNQDLTLPASLGASASQPLVVDGQSYYNSVVSGTAVWQAETVSSHRATF